MLQIVNVLFFRLKGRTLIGNRYRPGTREQERLKRFASTRNLSISVVATLLFIANLGFDIHRLLHFRDSSYAQAVLIYAPVSCILLFLGAIYSTYNKFGIKRSGRDKKDGS